MEMYSNNNQITMNNDGYYIKHFRMFYPTGIMEDFIDKIELHECLIIGNGQKKIKNNGLYKYNQNIDFMVKYWLSMYMNKYEPYKCPNGDIIWGIKTNKNKKYYFICEPNTIDINKIDKKIDKNSHRILDKERRVYYYNKNTNTSKIESCWAEYMIIAGGKIFDDNAVCIQNINNYKDESKINIEELCFASEPQWRLKQIRTQKSIKQMGFEINCFDLNTIIRRQYNPEYRFEFHRKKCFPKSYNLRQHIKNWLKNKMKQNPYNYIEYNNIKKTNYYHQIKVTPELAFHYHDKKDQNKLTQLIKTEADDINGVYYIVGIENKNDSAFLKFGAQYIFMMNNNEIETKFNWYFKQNNIVFDINNNNKNKNNDDYKYKYNELQKHYDSLVQQYNSLNQFSQLLLSYQQSYLVPNITTNTTNMSLPNYTINNVNINSIKNNDYKINKNEKKFDELDEFNQEIIEHEELLFENKELINITTTDIRHNNKDNDNNIIYYGAFCSKGSGNIFGIRSVRQIYIASTMKHAIQGLKDHCENIVNHKIHIIKCAVNKDIKDIHINGFDDTNEYIEIEGKEINKILQQRQVALK